MNKKQLLLRGPPGHSLGSSIDFDRILRSSLPAIKISIPPTMSFLISLIKFELRLKDV